MGEKVHVRYVNLDRNNKRPCSTFPANMVETGTDSHGNTQIYTRATGLQNGNKIATYIDMTRTMGDK